MLLKDLYSHEIIEKEFNTEKLYRMLLDNDFFEVKRQEVILKKGECVELEKGGIDYVYYISEGVAAINIEDQVIDFRGPADFFGLVDSTSVQGAKFSLNPLNEITMSRFEKNEVMAKIMSLQDGYLYHYTCMLDRYRMYENRIIVNDATDEKRTLLELREIGSKFGKDEVQKDKVVVPGFFTRKLIANYLGISRTKLSDILLKLRHEGLVTVDSKRQILVCLK
ncbi:Crp/Fnr family transcriptional regulator [Listeria booriae]|uniref:Crp/Fnr family transcriptional regulator n=1 Tax=Listeria booriae TaxID=1552123 RepID=A0A841ZYZ9_9LIST|nr:Crp/Fnr family transcriptional regulator [Listeria booriae]MBC1553886.1 Crp/Fnr family transcriptional regulator [Listeria booriae]MBC1565704.1 Crp/Fnr family transcriptional regulator [Listeria booriae]MBC2025716.1 Crp/Fnr family transcriptional regulator [Listeria booriae]MBC2148989.1 Crp/Fnr family transcriptional regulator [Listeria booriae]MBC2170854.1 Crp/Fnr family transcriptional regulator [Listeria booriae]